MKLIIMNLLLLTLLLKLNLILLIIIMKKMKSEVNWLNKYQKNIEKKLLKYYNKINNFYLISIILNLKLKLQYYYSYK